MAVKPKNSKTTVSWAQAFRDIIIKAMDRGQLLPVLLFLVLLAFIFKMSEENVYEFGVGIVNGFKDFSLFGWFVAAIVAILWAGHARQMRRNHSSEYQRIGREKSELQASSSSKIKLNSSNKN